MINPADKIDYSPKQVLDLRMDLRTINDYV